MGAVLLALGTMAAVAAVGWLLGRRAWLGPGAEAVLARVVFAVAAPALLVVTIAHADLHALLTRAAVVTVTSTAVVALVALAVLRLGWHRPLGDAVVGMLASSYLNAAYLGIPLAVYLLGDALAVVPTLLFQMLVLGPLSFLVLDSSRPGPDDGPRGRRVLAALAVPLRNPILVSGLVGVVLALLPWRLPETAFEPLRLVGAAAAPLALLAFGMSLARQRLGAGLLHRDLVLAVVLRSVVHPLLAYGVGRALGLEGYALLAVVTMAALPTAQNVLVYALHYGRGVRVARDAGLATTLLTVPVMLAVAAALA